MNEAPDHIDCLHLDIHNCICNCGNQWKHSELWLASKEAGYLGGTPTPEQEASLKVLSMVESPRSFSSCYACVPLSLGKSWIASRDLARAALAASRAALTEDLLA